MMLKRWVVECQLLFYRRIYGWDLPEYTYQKLLLCRNIEDMMNIVQVLHVQLVDLDGVVAFLVDTFAKRRSDMKYEVFLLQMSQLHKLYGDEMDARGFTVNVIWSCVSFVEYEKNYNLIEEKK